MTKTGQVIKTYNGFYYVLDREKSGQASYSDEELISCRVRGKVKRNKGAVVTGDMVEYELLGDGTGVIGRCLPRQTLMLRPAVANVDQVILTFAARQPDLHPLLLNKFLVLAEWSGIPEIAICVNKCDLLEGEQREEFLADYERAGYRVLRVSAKEKAGIDELRNVLQDRVTVFAGPSGVGKSSLLNEIDASLKLATGVISDKIKRGKHTTRSACLMPVVSGGIVVDTPGFSAAEIEEIMEEGDLAACFPEFRPYVSSCYFNTCTHTHEPGCGVKQAQEDGHISEERYKAYLGIYGALKDYSNTKRRY